MAVEVVVMAAVLGILMVGTRGQQMAAGSVPLLLVQSLVAVLAFGATTIAAVTMVSTLTNRMRDITTLVLNQASSNNLNLLLATEHADELGQLTDALNRLTQAYQQSLAEAARRADEMTTLNLVAQTISSTLDLQEVLDTSLRAVLKAVGWDAGAIYMCDDRTGALNMVSYKGLAEAVVRRMIAFEVGEGWVGHIGSRQEQSVLHEPTFAKLLMGTPLLGETGPLPAVLIGIPLTSSTGSLLGVLMIGSSTPRSVDQALDLLGIVAHQVSTAIDKAQLYAQVSTHAEQLERIVAARTMQLNEAIRDLSVALDRAKESDRLKAQLLSTVSHELRTPLATIKGGASLLKNHLARLEAEQVIQHLHDIEEESDNLTELISSLLEMSRIEAGMLRIQCQPFDLSSVLQGAVNAAQLRIPHHPITFEAAPDMPQAYGDARRVQQIIANLADNAAKYSPPGTPIHIACQPEGDELKTSVTDQGPGIAPDQLERIFEHFYQVNNVGDGGRQGIGLGLAICRGLVEAQNGRIWVESQLGQGSTFHFSLPARLS